MRSQTEGAKGPFLNLKKVLPKIFFQAEDGIRDCLLSRGLGDVYKRQALRCVIPDILIMLQLEYWPIIFGLKVVENAKKRKKENAKKNVGITYIRPSKYEVCMICTYIAVLDFS